MLNKIPGSSSQGRAGKGYDWLIKFSETELVSEGNFSYLFFVTKKWNGKGKDSIFHEAKKGPNLLLSALFIRTKQKQTTT